MLLSVTSLAGARGCGRLGAPSRAWLQTLRSAGCTLWQILPLTPPLFGESPYMSASAFALHAALIDEEDLLRDGLACPTRCASLSQPEEGWDPAGVRRRMVALATDPGAGTRSEGLDAFREAQSTWLEDYALFVALKEQHDGRPWWEWPAALRDRDPQTLESARRTLAERISAEVRIQWWAHEQACALRSAAREEGITLFGDMPLFVAHDSADVWAQRALFRVAPDGSLPVVAGVPPDAFSEEGQRWGNPHYAWSRHEADGFAWWRARVERQLTYCDALRIDHFRGLVAVWEVPGGDESAALGRWVETPGDALLSALRVAFPEALLVAEDLGVITEEVNALREAHALPGMHVLQFAFGGAASNPHLPHHHRPEGVVYTGTHDNDTLAGWCETLDPRAADHARAYLGVDALSAPCLVRTALASVATWAILPVQDLLPAGSAQRLNHPGSAEGNWSWRMSPEGLAPAVTERLAHWTSLYGRSGTALASPEGSAAVADEGLALVTTTA